MFRNQNITPSGLDCSDLLFISTEYENQFRNKRLKSGDLLTMRTGYPGVTAIVPNEYEGAQSFTTLITRPNTNCVATSYLCCYINSATGHKFFEQSQIGGAQKNVNVATLKTMPIPLPPTLHEQEAIAGALSDADAWIESLEQLIAKKRQIKQGAMQELLTGKRRLPGFSGKWETKRLGDLGSTYGGLTGKTKTDFGAGGAMYVTFMNVMSNVVIDCTTFERVNVVASESQNRVVKNDILFNGSSETPEEVAMCALVDTDVTDVYLNSFCFGFRFRDDVTVDGRFLAYYLRSNVGREIMKSLAQGSTRYNLSKTALLKAVLQLPSPNEQTAIATVLSDMDNEIELLESKLAKARDVKQGMMQELLTGRIRLV
jgi:type I restriction enzyme S subunit